jgi:type I restriction enzyme M protein
VDLDEVHKELLELESKIQKYKDEHNGYLKELGLELLP